LFLGFQHILPAQFRQLHIEHEQIGLFFAGQSETFVAVSDSPDHVSGAGEGAPCCYPQELAVSTSRILVILAIAFYTGFIRFLC
jgi:hypothetical protein